MKSGYYVSFREVAAILKIADRKKENLRKTAHIRAVAKEFELQNIGRGENMSNGARDPP